MNARFWIWWNDGFVKLTLRPYQRVGLCEGRQTDEGYSCHAVEWEHYGNGVARESTSWGCDCDGRYEHRQDDWCDLENLRVRPDGNDELLLPEWEAGESSQRDEYAELAGY